MPGPCLKSLERTYQVQVYNVLFLFWKKCCRARPQPTTQVSHRESSIVVLPAANLRGSPDKYGLLTLGRPSVRCYSTLRAWSPVCGSTLRVSQAARPRWLLADAGLILLIFLECCGMNSFFLVTQSFSPHR